MAAFLDTTRIPVREGPDTFWIKPKMDFGTKCRVEDTLTQMALKEGGAGGEIQFTLGAQRLALAVHNIVAWDGPDFVNVPCTRENIERLDPDFPLLKAAQDEITRRNTPREEPASPLPFTTDTVKLTPASNGAQLADTVST